MTCALKKNKQKNPQHINERGLQLFQSRLKFDVNRITFGSCLNCDINHTCDVFQFKRSFFHFTKSQFNIRLKNTELETLLSDTTAHDINIVELVV